MAVATTAPPVSEEDKKQLIDRLARVEGQLRGIQRMIGEEKSCEAIAQQIAAARGALNKAFAQLIACAFQHRLSHGDEQSDSSEVAEIVALLSKYG